MEKLQLRWVLAQVKSSGRFWQHEDAESYGDPRALKVTSGFGNNCPYRGTYLSLNPLVLIYVAFGPCRSDSSCSFLSASRVFLLLFVLKWINSPIKKDLLWEVSVKCWYRCWRFKKTPQNSPYPQPHPWMWFCQLGFGHTREQSYKACIVAAHLIMWFLGKYKDFSFLGPRRTPFRHLSA